MTNILDPSALISALPKYIPPDSELRQPQDALTSLIHTILTVLGFRLIGVDDSSTRGTFNDNALPDGWNTHGTGGYTLRYTHEQSSLEFVVKVSKLGSRTVINAIAIEASLHPPCCGRDSDANNLQTDKTTTLDIATNDFLSPSFFPHKLEAEGTSLVHGFISSNRVADFVSQFQLKIIQKLIPGLRKEGYTEEAEDASTNSTSQAGQSSRDGQRAPPFMPERPQLPPGFASGMPDRRNPLEIGRSDVFPDALRNPFAPPPLFPDTSGAGMFVGPDHPIFGNRQGNSPGGLGPFGGDGYLPPQPPGARFDPIFPGPLGPGGRRLGGRGGLPQRSGEPDNDEFMPPGTVSEDGGSCSEPLNNHDCNRAICSCERRNVEGEKEG